jgi:glycosyltransferase involved in cell wall biosynthesis
MIFSIIIIVRNRIELLKYSLMNLNFMAHDGFEVVIVDDGSDSLIAEAIREMPLHYRHRIIRNQVPKGISGARNTGIEGATGDILIFTDAGMLFPFDFLDQYQGSYEKNGAGCAIAGNTLYLSENDLPRGNTAEMETYQEFFTAIRDQRIATFPCEVRKWYGIISPDDRWKCFIGNNCSCRKNDIGNNLRFETRFSGWGCDDSEFAYRLAKQGMNIVIDFNLVNYHLFHPTIPRDEQVKQFMSNNAIFHQLHPEVPWSGILPPKFFIKQLEKENIDPGLFASYWRAMGMNDGLRKKLPKE